MEQKWVEMIAAVLGVVSVVFVIRRQIWAFPIGIGMAALYCIIFFQQGYYAQMGLQVFFIGMQVWGWYQWKGGEQSDDKRIAVLDSIGRRGWLFSGLVLVVGMVLITLLLKTTTDSELPYLDATTTTLSLVAQWWMNRQQIRHWLIWIVTDALLIVQMAYAELYWSVGLYSALLIQAVIGFYTWKKQQRKKKKRQPKTRTA